MNIFVGNLSFQATENEIHSAFSQYGIVGKVNVVTDRESGQPRGFAFVEMTNREEAQAAIDRLNGSDLHGRALNVNEARPKPAFGSSSKDRSGFGGGNNRRDSKW